MLSSCGTECLSRRKAVLQLSKSPLLSTFPTKALYVTKHQHYSDVDIDFDNAAADDDDDDDDSTSDQLQVLILHSLFTLSPLSSRKTVLTFTELHNAQCRQQLGVHCAKYFLPPSLRAKLKQCKLVPPGHIKV